MKKLILLSLLVTSSVFAASSAEERGSKTHELTLQFGYDYFKFTGQAAYMYFLNADNLIGVKVGSVSGYEEHQTNISAQYQTYLGNSFYLAPEIFYVNTREDVDSMLGLLTENDLGEQTSLGAGIRIGNQWTWKLITLGCDWIGVGHRFVYFKKDSDKLNDTPVTLLNFKLGISF